MVNNDGATFYLNGNTWFRSGPRMLLASLQYATVAFAAMYGVLFWGDTFSATSVFGVSLISLSGIVALRRVGNSVRIDT